MKFVLTICGVLFGISSDQEIERALHAPAALTRSFVHLLQERTSLVRVLPGRLLSHRPSRHAMVGTRYDRATVTGRPVPDGDTEGFGSPGTEGPSSPLPISRRWLTKILIVAAILAFVVIAITLYIGELVVLGWVVDFLSQIGMPKIQPRLVPLDYEQVGEIIVVTLRDNIATVGLCLSVQKQLKRLLEEQHCDFVLDFSSAARISKSFRGVMVHFMKAARKEAARLGKPYRSVALPRGAVFRVFDDRDLAVEEMARHDGHGWVVLCAVPPGTRAVSGLT